MFVGESIVVNASEKWEKNFAAGSPDHFANSPELCAISPKIRSGLTDGHDGRLAAASRKSRVEELK
jgi:hypothetical protein